MINVECDSLSCCPVVQKFAELRASLRANQSRLSEHGAAVMLLQVLASTGGQHPGALVQMCLHLGVALLKGGNHTVQRVRVVRVRVGVVRGCEGEGLRGCEEL